MFISFNIFHYSYIYIRSYYFLAKELIFIMFTCLYIYNHYLKVTPYYLLYLLTILKTFIIIIWTKL